MILITYTSPNIFKIFSFLYVINIKFLWDVLHFLNQSLWNLSFVLHTQHISTLTSHMWLVATILKSTFLESRSVLAIDMEIVTASVFLVILHVTSRHLVTKLIGFYQWFFILAVLLPKGHLAKSRILLVATTRKGQVLLSSGQGHC